MIYSSVWILLKLEDKRFEIATSVFRETFHLSTLALFTQHLSNLLRDSPISQAANNLKLGETKREIGEMLMLRSD